MPSFLPSIGVLAGLTTLAAFIPYIIAILRGETHPNRASWFIWVVVGVLLGASYRSSGATDTIFVPISFVIGPLVVSVLSIRYGIGGWGTLDKISLAGALLSLPIWILTSNPLTALIVNLTIDFLGAIPTAAKALTEPESENKIAWTLWFTGNILNLFAISERTFNDAAYPIYMAVGSGIIFLLVIWPRRPRTKNVRNPSG